MLSLLIAGDTWINANILLKTVSDMTKYTEQQEPISISRGAPGAGITKFKISLRILYLVSIVIYASLLYDGISFYSAPYKERPRHEEYRQLRPAGMTGHTYGVVGSAFMIFMLSYSLRKRAKFLRNKGRLNRWLDIHIFLGVMGPLLVVLHTSLKVQGLVAVSFWSMVAVATSGIFGRYLYLQIPRNLQGEELSMKEIEEENSRYARRLREEYKLGEDVIRILEERDAPRISEEDGMLKVLFTIIRDDALRPFRFGHRRHDYTELENVPPHVRGEVIRISHRKALMARRIMLLNRIQQLFHYWHVIHKPFAMIMYTIMLIHIVVAVWTGYKWVF